MKTNGKKEQRKPKLKLKNKMKVLKYEVSKPFNLEFSRLTVTGA